MACRARCRAARGFSLGASTRVEARSCVCSCLCGDGAGTVLCVLLFSKHSNHFALQLSGHEKRVFDLTLDSLSRLAPYGVRLYVQMTVWQCALGAMTAAVWEPASGTLWLPGMQPALCVRRRRAA